MNNDDRYLELLTEMVMKQDSSNDELKILNKQVKVIKEDISEMKEDIKKLNLISAENSRAILKLANLLETEVLSRIAKLEAEVFHR